MLLSAHRREHYCECRTFPFLTLHIDGRSVLLCDRLADRKSRSRPVPSMIPCSIEPFENMGYILLGNSNPGV